MGSLFSCKFHGILFIANSCDLHSMKSLMENEMPFMGFFMENFEFHG